MKPLDEIRQGLARLSDPQALLEGIFAYAPFGLQIYEASGRCLLVNEGFRDLFGTAPPPDYNVLEDEIAERNGVLGLIHRAFAGETVAIGPIWYDPRELKQVAVTEGRRVAIASTFFPLFDRAGKVGHVAIVFRDLTDEMAARERAEQESERNQRLYQEAQELHRLRDEFVATISHELRTPLQAILGWARLLQETSDDRERLRHGLATIERNAKVQARLVDDILDASRLVTGRMQMKWQAVDLAATVRGVLGDFQRAAAAKGVDLVEEMPPDPLVVGGDADRLHQVAWNLCSNALKFTPAGGRIRVALRAEADEAVLGVADTGVGIAPEFLPFVFDRFRQGDSSSTRMYGGLGLGLALVRHLVELHGGSVEAHSPGRDQGAVFTVRLRLQPDARTDPPPPRAEEGAAARLSNVRALVVDDEADTRDLLATALGHSGADVQTVASAHEALAALRQRPPDIIVCDIGMPGEDGLALLAQVRALTPAEGGLVPAVALTGYARPDDRRRALAAGYQVHLSKPVDPAELVAVVARVATRRP